MTRIFPNSHSNNKLRHEGANCYLQMTWASGKSHKTEQERKGKRLKRNDRTTAHLRCNDTPSSIPVHTVTLEDQLLSFVGVERRCAVLVAPRCLASRTPCQFCERTVFFCLFARTAKTEDGASKARAGHENF